MSRSLGTNTNYKQPNTLARHETLSIVYLKAVALHTNLSVNQVYALTSKYINTVTPEGEFNLGCQLKNFLEPAMFCHLAVYI